MVNIRGQIRLQRRRSEKARWINYSFCRNPADLKAIIAYATVVWKILALKSSRSSFAHTHTHTHTQIYIYIYYIYIDRYNKPDFVPENWFENGRCEMAAILYRSQCINCTIGSVSGWILSYQDHSSKALLHYTRYMSLFVLLAFFLKIL